MFRFIIAIAFFLLAFSSHAFSQSAAVSGKVTNLAGEPLPGAHITVSGLQGGSSADNNGFFLLGGLPAGAVTLRISHVGFAAQELALTLAPGESRQIEAALRSRAVDVGEVTVRATRAQDLVRNLPQPLSVVGYEQLLRHAPVSVPDALEAEAGVALVRDGVWGTDISIRGMQRSNVVTLVDGVRIETATAHAAGMSLIDVTDIDRIEVLRGASSSMYGTGATGGVVNVITRGGDYASQLRFGGSVNSSFSSVNSGAAAALSLDAADEGWFLHAHAGLRAAEDAQTPDGVLRDSRFHDNSVSFAGGMRLGGTHELRVRWQRMRAEDVGIPGGASFPAMASARYPDEERRMFLGEYRSGPLGTALRGLTLRYARQDIARNVEIIPNQAVTLRPSADHAMHSVQLIGNIRAGAQQIVAGIDAWQRSYTGIRLREIAATKTTIADLPLPNARFRAIGMFVQDDVALFDERLRLSLGGRFDGIHIENDAGYDLQYVIIDGVRNDVPANRQLRWTAEEADELSWSAHAGLLYQLTQRFGVSFNASRAFRAPSLEERYQFIELGGATYVGDPDLAAEKGSMLDIGLRYHGEKLALRTNVFMRFLNDLVVDSRIGDTLYRKENVGEAQMRGMEFTGEYNVLSTITAYASLAYVRGEDTGNDRDLPQIPPLSGRAGLRFPLFSVAEADVFSSFAADQDAVAPGEDPTPGYALFHLRLRSLPRRFAGVGVQLIAGVDNVFHRSWRRHLSTLRGLIVAEPGRNMYLRLRLYW